MNGSTFLILDIFHPNTFNCFFTTFSTFSFLFSVNVQHFSLPWVLVSCLFVFIYFFCHIITLTNTLNAEHLVWMAYALKICQKIIALLLEGPSVLNNDVSEYIKYSLWTIVSSAKFWRHFTDCFAYKKLKIGK